MIKNKKNLLWVLVLAILVCTSWFIAGCAKTEHVVRTGYVIQTNCDYVQFCDADVQGMSNEELRKLCLTDTCKVTGSEWHEVEYTTKDGYNTILGE